MVAYEIVPDTYTCILTDGNDVATFNVDETVVFNPYGNPIEIYTIVGIGQDAFKDYTNLTTVTFSAPENITSIGDNAFNGCTRLTRIVIPENVTNIGAHAFDNCRALVNVRFSGSSISTIGEYAFYHCWNLLHLTLPQSITNIGDYAFDDCLQLNPIFLGNPPNASILFSTTDFKYIYIYDDNTYKDNWSTTFAGVAVVKRNRYANVGTGCKLQYVSDRNPTTFSIPASVNGRAVISIDDSALSYYTALTQITIPSTVTSIGSAAFEFCSSLISVTFDGEPTNLTLGAGAFYACSSLPILVLPSTLTFIDDVPLIGCTSLSMVVFLGNVPSCGGLEFGEGFSGKVYINTTNTYRTQWVNYSNSNGGKFLNADIVFMPAGTYQYINQTECILSGTPANISSFVVPNTAYVNYVPYTVTGIGGAFANNTSLTTVTFEHPANITTIGQNAFLLCTSLTSITIPSNVSSIGNTAFFICTSLTTLTIPASVTSIGDSAFANCTQLTHIARLGDVPTIGETAFDSATRIYITNDNPHVASWVDYSYTHSGKLSNATIVISDLYVRIGSSCTLNTINNKYITSFEVPTSVNISGVSCIVTSIGAHAFQNCHSLTTVTYATESNIINIGASAFRGCEHLINVTIPSGVTSIPDEVFKGCSSLARITIPSGVTSIGASAFQGCTSLTNIACYGNVPSIGTNVFENVAIIYIYANNPNYDNWQARGGSLGLAQIVLAQDIYTPFGESSCTLDFIGNRSIQSYVIPTSVNSRTVIGIGAHAFQNCHSLTTVTCAMDSNIISIGNSAFNGCEHLINITIPSGVTSIGASAFQGCTSLTNIVCYGNVPSIGTNVFESTARINIYSNNPNYADWQAFGNSLGLAQIIFVQDVYTPLDESSCILDYIGNKSRTSFEIPTTVNSRAVIGIGAHAFENCHSLTTITYVTESNIIRIGASAFANCAQLPNMVIPSNVTIIGENAFDNCTSMSYLILTGDVPTVTNSLSTGGLSVYILSGNAYFEHWRSQMDSGLGGASIVLQ